jgi:hypothetical protein
MALVAATILSPAAQATSLTLGCTGTLTRTYVPKNGVATEPRKEPVSDYSIVVDLDRRAKEANANGISFEADRRVGRTEGHITGGLDRNTGAVNADDFTTFSGGASQHQNWDLHCRSR